MLAVLTVAAGFRFIALENIPPGMLPAEALNGTRTLEATHTDDTELFTSLLSLSVGTFGNTVSALRVVSAAIGVLTVLGLYLLARLLFNNIGIATLSALLMAMGFWHILFSRLALREILIPAVAVWALYYLYMALRSNRLWHWGLAGALFGIGLHTHTDFRMILLAALVPLLVYWQAIRKDFAHERFSFTRTQVAGGIAVALALFVLVAVPLRWYMPYAPAPFDDGMVTSASDVTEGIVRTLGMFVLAGETDWAFNVSGEPLLFWPIAALFVVGLARSILKVGRTLRTHGHFSTVHALLLGWFFIGLIPAFRDSGVPSAVRALAVVPVVYLFAAEGLWWLYAWMRHSYEARDKRMVRLPEYLEPGSHGHTHTTTRGRALAFLAILAFLVAIGANTANQYFRSWGTHPSTEQAYFIEYISVAQRINERPAGTPVFVLIEPGDGPLYDGYPLAARIIMYLTDSATADQQQTQSITYLGSEAFDVGTLPRGALFIHMRP